MLSLIYDSKCSSFNRRWEYINKIAIKILSLKTFAHGSQNKFLFQTFYKNRGDVHFRKQIIKSVNIAKILKGNNSTNLKCNKQ